MIHKAIVKSEVAERYYKLKHPERKYSRFEAIKRFGQDSNIDKTTVQLIVSNIFEEQKKLFKSCQQL